MPNYAVDFVLNLAHDPEEDLSYEFRFGRCTDFKYALALVKQIPFEERDYDPEDEHRWKAKANTHNFNLLCQAFDNFRALYEVVKYQTKLPGF